MAIVDKVKALVARLLALYEDLKERWPWLQRILDTLDRYNNQRGNLYALAIAFSGMSTVWVHMQFCAQFGGRLSPLQSCSGGTSSICERSGAGAETYEISSMSDIKWSPPGATGREEDKLISNQRQDVKDHLPKNRLYVLGANISSGR